jgi:hypothetical protein
MRERIVDEDQLAFMLRQWRMPWPPMAPGQQNSKVQQGDGQQAGAPPQARTPGR